jgi:type VI secretion system protein ImpA
MLLDPITAEAPCGEDLEDTQLLASFDGFRIFGQAAPLEPVPDWSEIRNRSLEALRRSKDLRVLAHYASAVLRTDGVPAFADTIRVAAAWLESWWTDVYPLATEDLILRTNSLNCFADPMGVIDGLRRMPLIVSRAHGTFSLRDIDIATGQVAPREGDGRPNEDQINAAIAAMPPDELAELHGSVASAVTALRSIDARMRDEGGPEAAPSFDPLSAQLGRIERLLRPYATAAAPSDDVATEAAPEESAAAGSDDGGRRGVPGAIRSRQDAIRAIDAAVEFFRTNEPSSPVPMFLERAKRLVSKDFLEVLADVAPDAVPQARAAGGLPYEG